MNIEPEIVAAVIGGLTGLAISMITNYAMRTKNKADASKAISEAVTNLIGPLNERIENQEKKICTQDKKISSLEKKLTDFLTGIKRLVKQIKDHGAEPVWVPEELQPIPTVKHAANLKN